MHSDRHSHFVNPARSSFRGLARWPMWLGVAILAGCSGEEWHADTYPVSGHVFINGRPAAGAVVELRSVEEQPDSRNSRPWGIVQSDGTYALTTYEKADGAPPGQYALTLRWPSDISSPSHVDRLSGAYADPENALTTVAIKPQENEIPKVELTDIDVLSEDTKPSSTNAMPGPGPRRRR